MENKGITHNDNTQSISIDDVITYKEDNGIVYGYLNQKALDCVIYNRAKQNTQDFTILEESDDGEEPKRALKLDDISIQRHCIVFRPLSEGEYVEKGGFILDLGLYYLSSYCRENNISEKDTMLYSVIRLFSNYAGYYSNKVDDEIFGSCNLGNTIKDGDLLFTIQLAKKQEEEFVFSSKDVRFAFNILSKDFWDSVRTREIMFKSWLVDNYTNVKKGDDILDVTEFIPFLSSLKPQFCTTIKSPYSGLLVKKYEYKGYSEKLKNDVVLFTIYADESKLKDNYPNEVIITTDAFTKSVIIKGIKCAGSSFGFMLDGICINFENNAGKNFLLLRYNRKDFNINKKSSLHLLLSDDSVITLKVTANPIKVYASESEAKFLLSTTEMHKLETERFIKWQITNEEGITIGVGNNSCCLESGDDSGITEKLSYEVFQSFIADFNKTVKENIPENEQVEEQNEIKTEDVKEKGTCYVYLMIDTTNNFHKIGISNNPRYREHTLQSDKPTIELLCAKEYPSRIIAESIEAALHKAFASKRIRGEWFNLGPTDIDEIKKTLK